MIGRNLLLAIPITGITIWTNHFQMVSFGPVIVFLLYCSIVTWMLYREQWRDVMLLASGDFNHPEPLKIDQF